MSALLAFCVGLLEHFFGFPLQAWLLICLSVPVFWIGAYKAWEKKRDELAREKQRNKLPDLKGRILEGFIGPAISSEGTAGLGKGASVVVLRLEVWNTVQMDRVSLGECQLVIRSGNFPYYGKQRCEIPDLRGITL